MFRVIAPSFSCNSSLVLEEVSVIPVASTCSASTLKSAPAVNIGVVRRPHERIEGRRPKQHGTHLVIHSFVGVSRLLGACRSVCEARGGEGERKESWGRGALSAAAHHSLKAFSHFCFVLNAHIDIKM